jgi:ribosomal protein L15
MLRIALNGIKNVTEAYRTSSYEGAIKVIGDGTKARTFLKHQSSLTMAASKKIEQ